MPYEDECLLKRCEILRNLISFCIESLRHLTRHEKKYAFGTALSLILLSLLDLVGIILLGTVAALTFNLVTGDSSLTRLEVFLQQLFPISLDRISLLGFISVVAVVLLLLKTLLQALFSFKFGMFLASVESRISSQLFELMLRSNLRTLQANKFSDYQYALLVGANRFTTGIVGSVVYFSSDLATAILMSIFAVYASPAAAFSAMAVFTFAYFVFNGPINRKAYLYGESARKTHLLTTENILESLQGIREIRIYQKESGYINLFKKQKREQSMTNQKTLWLNGLIRYILEVAILLAGSVAALVLIITADIRQAITVVTIFLVIGFRLIPNIQRLQNSLNSLRLSRAATADLFRFIDDFEQLESTELFIEKAGVFEKLLIEKVHYAHGDNQTLTNINLQVPKLSVTLIMGESGSGKSTLLDLISGLTVPTSGSISYYLTNDQETNKSITRFPMSYITQECALMGSNLIENITLENSEKILNQSSLNQIVSSLGLDKLSLRSLSVDGNDEIRSDRTNISGGERQRISIARAMYFDREIVLMDEPTSALDKDNLEKVYDYIRSIKGKKTVIISTHSEELLEFADYVLELSNGHQTFFGPVAAFVKEKRNFA